MFFLYCNNNAIRTLWFQRIEIFYKKKENITMKELKLQEDREEMYVRM